MNAVKRRLDDLAWELPGWIELGWWAVGGFAVTALVIRGV